VTSANHPDLSNQLTAAILIIGLPGSGKTTLAQRLAGTIGAEYFSASGLLREHLRLHPEQTRWKTDYWDNGCSAPDSEVLPVLWDAYVRGAGQVLVLDGYPREVSQLADFIDRGGRLRAAVLLEVAPVEALRRLSVRRSDEARSDDHPELARARLVREKESIDALCRHSALRGILARIDSGRPVPEVLADILFALDRS
jgi:adenylate kinase family enzyme